MVLQVRLISFKSNELYVRTEGLLDTQWYSVELQDLQRQNGINNFTSRELRPKIEIWVLRGMFLVLLFEPRNRLVATVI